MSDETYKVGDIVQLKSGGALLTIDAVYDTMVRCTWLTTEGRHQQAMFALDVLQPAKPLMDYVEDAKQYVAGCVEAFRQREKTDAQGSSQL